MPKRFMFLVMAGLVACATFGNAQSVKAVEIKTVPVKQTSAVSGESMYVNYCAACHGANGKGAGPALHALSTRPTDLTTLARNNGGKFPTNQVVVVLRYGLTRPAQGSLDMPAWGPILASMNQANQATEEQQRISNLTRFLNTMQVN
jgi:mono/diheme cytochrome c family protein